MQIQSVSNNSPLRQNPQFKAAYPVYHWVAETNGSYAPVIDAKLTKSLQRTLVSVLNKTKKASYGYLERIANRVSERDKDYKRMNLVRSYFNKKGGYKKDSNKFLPISYLISGNDVDLFEQFYAKSIGTAKAISPRKNGRLSSAESQIAIENYKIGGLNFVNSKDKRIVDENGMEYALHTKFEVVRGKKSGKVNGYRLVDVKFCPQKGSENPFVRTGYLRESDLK